jgi:predicted Rossmann fold flavoprotein
MGEKSLIIIGGGAAGIFCAANVARLNPALKITVLEKSSKLLSKVKVSGGGRCNITHACFDIGDMSKQYPRGQNFVKKTFHQFFTTDTISWFEERGVLFKTEYDGRIFPVTDSSQTIIDCLIREVNKYGVEIRMSSEAKSVRIDKGNFVTELSDRRALTSNFLSVACGGYPRPSMFDWLRALGHSIEEPLPSLFTFNVPSHPITKLMGVSVAQTIIKIVNTKLECRGPLLITHWGLSGPAILKLSSVAARELALKDYEFKIVLNWLPDLSEQEIAKRLQAARLEVATNKVSSHAPFILPQRLWELLVEEARIPREIRWADLPGKQLNLLAKSLAAYELNVRGKTTFKEEFVTAGGIKLNEVDANTMMSKKVKNLFFAGEILDVDGITGGFNFQHAWTSAFIAAKSIALSN